MNEAMRKYRVPEKYFYTIGDVSKLTGVKSHVLRYWETQFSALRPQRRYSGHRKYTIREVDIINKIRYLVLDKKYTIEGASREINKELNRPGGLAPVVSSVQEPTVQNDKILKEIKRDVQDCLSLLSNPQNQPAELVTVH